MGYRNSKMGSLDSLNKAYFDRWANTYDDDRISRWFRYTQGLAIDEFNLKRGFKVLDIGCGTGYAVLQMGSIISEGRICGIDISSRMIDKARAKVPESLRERVEFRQASSENIPYSEGEFDNILCTNSFHHYPEPILALGEMYRVLRPGGKAVILENATDLSWYIWAWDRILRIIEKGHVRYYSSQEIGKMLKEAGFECVKLCYLKNEFLRHGKLFGSVQLWSGQKPK
jgi:ubiquinone/menaquinone biosynthesis C-methylase UbiE